MDNTVSALPLKTQQQNTWYVYIVAFIAAVGGFLFGYDLTIISGAIMFLEKQFSLNAVQMGFAISSAMVGCIVGPVIGGSVADWVGRKKALMIAAFLFGISAIGTALPKQMLTFYIFRIIGGLGVGLASVVSPMYIAEIAPAQIRGRLVSMNQLAIVIGLTISVIVSYFIAKYIVFNVAWRWMFASEVVPILFFLIALLLVPESPRWLVKKKRSKQALYVLAKIENKERAEKEVNEITKSLSLEKGGVSELFARGVRTALFIAVGLAVFQQITGSSTLVIYAPIIFQKAGFEQITDALFQSIVLHLWNIAMTVVAIFLVDRVGRRFLLICGTLGMTMGMTLMGICFHFNLFGIWTVLMMFFCVGAYVVSLGPLAWLIMSEIFPTRIRGFAMGIAGITVWISCYLTGQVFPPIMEYFKNTFGSEAGTFWIFAGICFIALVFCWKMVPETKGRTLEEISQNWISK